MEREKGGRHKLFASLMLVSAISIGNITSGDIKNVEASGIQWDIQNSSGYPVWISPYDKEKFSDSAKVAVPELNVYQQDNYAKAEWAVEMLEQDVLIETSFEGNGTIMPTFPSKPTVHYQEGASYIEVNDSRNVSYRRYANGWVDKSHFDSGQGLTSITPKIGEKYTYYYVLKDGRYRLEHNVYTNGVQSITSDMSYDGDKSFKIGKTTPNMGNYFFFPSLSANMSYSEFPTIYDISNGMDLSLSFRAKTDSKATINPTLYGGMSSWTYPFHEKYNLKDPVTVSKPAKKGDKRIYINGIEQLNVNGTYYVTNRTSKSEKIEHHYFRILTINKAEGYIETQGALTEDWDVGYLLQAHTNRTPVDFNTRTIENGDGWVLFNVNAKVKSYEDYNSALLGLIFWFRTVSEGNTYIDDVKFGYATKARLYRGDKMLYEGYLSDYEDKQATDKNKPNSVANIDVQAKQGNLLMTIQKPEDNGTEYEYTVKAVSNKGDTVSSEKKNLTVTSGVDGYSYVVDKNSSTIPDDTIDTRSEEAQMPITDKGKHFIHIKAIDKAGNVSDVKHIEFELQDNISPEMVLTQNPTDWTNSSVQITAVANDSQTGVKRVQLPDGNWVNGATAQYSVGENGTYTFKSEDISGNITTENITISNIDKIAPTATHIVEHTEGDNYKITITGVDELSGIKRIKLPNGSYVNGSVATLNAVRENSYRFLIEDNAGNVLTYEVKTDVPELNVYQKEKHVKAEWAVEMPDKDILYQTGFEDGEEIPKLNYGGTDKAGGLTGGQSLTTGESYSGSTALKIVDTYTNGQHAGNPDLDGIIPFSNYSRAIFSRKYVENGTDLSISFRAKTTGSGKITPTSASGSADYGSPLDITFLEDVKSGSKTAKVSNPLFFKNYIDKGTRYYLANKKGKYSTIYVTSVDMNTSTITVNSPFMSDFKQGENVLKHVSRVPVNFSYRNISNKDWEIFNVNTSVMDYVDYDTLLNGFGFTFHTETKDVVYIDELKIGYATKSRLYRGDKMLYEGYLSDYEDKEATDKSKPNNIADVSVQAKQGNIYMNIQKPEDTGTEYEYTLKAVSNQGDTVSSEKKKVTVTTGVDGYSYIIDNNPTTIPDNTIDTRSEEVQIPIADNGKHYIHIKAIDKAGNASEVKHIEFQDNIAPEMVLTQNPTDWTASNVQITVVANDNQIGMKRIKLPNGNWVGGTTATFTVSQNGTYTFIAEDLVGNKTTKSIEIKNIDKTPPNVPIISNNQEWSKEPISVSIKGGTDEGSGVKHVEYKLEGATSKSWTTYTGSFIISNEGETKIIARTVDNLGNISSEAISYARIDETAPHNNGIIIHLKGK